MSGIARTLSSAQPAGQPLGVFFAEAGAMGLFGGIFGVALGWLIGEVLTWGTTIYLRRQDLPGPAAAVIPNPLAPSASGVRDLLSLCRRSRLKPR